MELALAVSLLTFIFLLFLLWAFSERSRNFGKAFYEGRSFFRCPICTHLYTIDRDDELSRCPRCNSFNKHRA